jgi:4-hydroxy-tetrahydrodipicolinate synthase
VSIDKVRAALHGISGIHVTPYDSADSIDHVLLRQIVSRMAAAGVHNIVSCGNTGEFFTLTEQEVLAVQAIAVEAVGGRAVATAAVGRSLAEAKTTARAARAAGFDAIMAHHPLDPFAAPQSQAAYFLALADSSELPLVAYLRSDAMAVADILRVATHPNVAGVKFASTNLMLLAQCIRAARGSTAIWVCGLAEGWAAPFYAQGARGFTSGLVNVAPERSLAIWRALEAGDYQATARLVDEIAPFEAMRTRYNNGANVTVVKEAMRLMGVPVGPVRLPGLPALETADCDRLRAILTNWGFDLEGAAA